MKHGKLEKGQEQFHYQESKMEIIWAGSFKLRNLLAQLPTEAVNTN